MIESDHPMAAMLREGSISPEELADSVIEGLDKEGFLILPHPEVQRFIERKAGDYDGWLATMQGIRQNLLG